MGLFNKLFGKKEKNTTVETSYAIVTNEIDQFEGWHERSLIWETWPRVVPGRLRRIPSAEPWRARCSNRSGKCLILSVLAADCGEQKGKIGRKSAGSSTRTINLNSQPLSKQ